MQIIIFIILLCASTFDIVCPEGPVQAKVLLLRPHRWKNKVTKIKGNFIYFKTLMSCEQLPVVKKITFLNAILKIEINNILVKKSYVQDSMMIYQQNVYRHSCRPYKISLKSG